MRKSIVFIFTFRLFNYEQNFKYKRDDYSGKFPETSKQFNDEKENNGEALGESWKCPMDVARTGLRLMEFLGVGGMGTRGFGRMKPLADWEVE